MTEHSSDALLSSFVLRGRRVAAHSLAQDRQGLEAHARGEMKGTLDSTGQVTVTQLLPDNEELFESLAARLRPLTVRREPIYFEKVLDAIEPHIIDPERQRFEALRGAWRATEIQGVQVQGYSVQQSNKDGSNATGQVSDTQLAAAWLYADLVHADATGPKAAALAFPLHERYAAAVRVFSHIALLTLSTLELVNSLAEAGRVRIDPDAADGEVVVGVTELTRQARAFFAEKGSEPPDLRTSPDWPEEWTQLTIMEMRRQDPGNHVRVELRHAGDLTAAYDAAVLRRDMSVTPAVWDVLVADCTVFKFLLDRDAGGSFSARFDGQEDFKGTNAQALASALLQMQASDADTVAFQIGGAELFRLEFGTLEADDARQLRVVAEVLADIVAIERLTGEELAVSTRFDNGDRVQLRRARMLHEGRLIRATHGPLRVTTPEGHPPLMVFTPASTLDIGGALVPVPARVRWHPQMTVAPDPAGKPNSFDVALPEGERFLMWAPERLSVSTESDLPEVTDYEDFADFGRDPAKFD